MQGLHRDWSFRDAFAFGWDALPAALAEHLPLYVVFALAGAAIEAFLQPPARDAARYAQALAIFPALAVGMRRISPGFVMTADIVVRILAVWAAAAAVYWVTIDPLLVFGHRNPIFALIALTLLVVYIWLQIKLSLSIPLYVLQPEAHRNMIHALYDSYELVAGSFWWTLVGLDVCVWLCAALLPNIAAHAIEQGFSASWIHFAASFIACAGKTVAYVWCTLCLLGIATAERREEAYAV